MSEARTAETAALRVLGLGTAVPSRNASQDQVANFMARVLEATVEPPQRARALEMMRRLYAASGVRRRYGVIGDFALEDPRDFEFFPPNWELEPFPSTAVRMRAYEQASVDLAARACRGAMEQAGVFPQDITHIVVSTCTGFFAPGPDVLLSQLLGMRASVRRTVIGFMGCYAGFTGLRLAEDILRADPGALVMQVCIELCSLHYQKKPEIDLLVANCLFGDGCAAVLHGAPRRYESGLVDLRGSSSHVERDSLDQMAWHIGNHGFEMRLSPEIPKTLRSRAPEFVDGLLDRADLSRDHVASWAVHPGGPKILEAVEVSLGLGNGALTGSSEVLRDYGNMSSATIFFILDRLLRAEDSRGPIVALGFGPGLTLEGAVFMRP